MSAPGHGAAPSGDELDPDEPRTPLWLPLLGLVLFLSALIYVLVGSSSADAAAEGAAPAGSASVAPEPAPPS